MSLLAWVPFALLAAGSMTAFREIAGLAIRRHEPPYFYTGCYFGLVVAGMFALTFMLKTWEYRPW